LIERPIKWLPEKIRASEDVAVVHGDCPN